MTLYFEISARKRLMPMPIEPILYFDPQAALDVRYCEVCGGACFSPGYRCLRCERSVP